MNGRVTLFADDTNIFYFGQSIEEIQPLIMGDLEILHEWLHLNQFFIKTEKTNYIFFKKPHRNVAENVTSYQGHEIKRVNCAKFLGLYLDENLHWNEHINFVIKKISPVIRMMSRLQTVLTENAKKCVYYGLIQSSSTHDCCLWNCDQQQIRANLCPSKKSRQDVV